MNLTDIKIGEKYKMIEADTDLSGKIIFIKKDAIVQVLDKDSGSDLDVLVQDLSKRKITDGVWWISHVFTTSGSFTMRKCLIFSENGLHSSS